MYFYSITAKCCFRFVLWNLRTGLDECYQRFLPTGEKKNGDGGVESADRGGKGKSAE